MTKVRIDRRKGKYSGFCCDGHTGYAEAGEDIVCAGVSAIVINTVNCLEDLLEEDISYSYEEEGGRIELKFRSEPSEKAEFLIDCMIHGLKWIRLQYGSDHLDYQVREVS
ncbi:MAG: ribosomal-processing cysteine protease Prp [Lachnospiraceae bacterium]|nr:ribosomal-processing cysteine protease Prp [Lachnospiraceae bacterium]